jgi:hypothetical protein
MKNKRFLIIGVALVLFAVVAGNVFAIDLETGGYIRQSDAGKGTVQMIHIYFYSSSDIKAVMTDSSGNDRWEKKGRLQSNRIHLVPMSSSFNRVMGDGVIYLDVVSSTSFKWDGVLYVKASR